MKAVQSLLRNKSLEVLPDDILVDHIFKFLDVVDILNLRRVGMPLPCAILWLNINLDEYILQLSHSIPRHLETAPSTTSSLYANSSSSL